MIDHTERAKALVARWEHGDEKHRAWLRSVAVPDLIAAFEEVETPLRGAIISLNAAIDAYWNDEHRGLGLTGMGEHHMIRITDAQERCREALRRSSKHLETKRPPAD